MKKYNTPVFELLILDAADVLTLSNDKGLGDIFFKRNTPNDP